MLRVTVSGSFRKHLKEIAEVISELTGSGVDVVSPSDPTVVDSIGEFLFVASDSVRSVRLVQDRHLDAIRISNFLWLVSPDGYVGQSASLELGFAAAVGTPIFSATAPDDLTLRQYVHVVPNVAAAVGLASSLQFNRPPSGGLLIDPRERNC